MNSRISRLIKIAPALGVVAVLPLLAACNERAASAPAQLERPVQVQRVDFTNENPVREFVGVVRARHETDLGFRVAGKIIARSINVGDEVHTGDVVAQLDPQDLDLQVESAQAELTAATSNLADAAAEEARYANLKTHATVAAADYDHKKAAKDEAQGRLERAQRALDLARNQLDYAELKVDVDGVITATLAALANRHFCAGRHIAQGRNRAILLGTKKLQCRRIRPCAGALRNPRDSSQP